MVHICVVLGSFFFLEYFFTEALRVKPFDEISTIAFLEVIEKCLGYVFMLPFFEKS